VYSLIAEGCIFELCVVCIVCMLLCCSFLCIERYKFQSPKNIMIPLTNITSIEKVRPTACYIWVRRFCWFASFSC